MESVLVLVHFPIFCSLLHVAMGGVWVHGLIFTRLRTLLHGAYVAKSHYISFPVPRQSGYMEEDKEKKKGGKEETESFCSLAPLIENGGNA